MINTTKKTALLAIRQCVGESVILEKIAVNALCVKLGWHMEKKDEPIQLAKHKANMIKILAKDVLKKIRLNLGLKELCKIVKAEQKDLIYHLQLLCRI